MHKYPFLLKPYLKSVIWGGNTLFEKYGKDFIDRLGESWELSVFPGKESIIQNGVYSGSLLSDVIGSDYPVLIKFLNSALPLSVQVHPQKNEMWIILESDPDAKIVYGLNDNYSKEDISSAINSGNFESLLNYIPVKKGDVYYIPSGLVHALGSGLTVAEIQQTSDTTYRLYDYNRIDADGKPRELHVDSGVNVIKNFSNDEIYSLRYSKSESSDFLVNNDMFAVSDIALNNSSVSIRCDKFDKCILITEGKGLIDDIEINKGNCVYLPSDKSYSVEGTLSCIITEIFSEKG